MDPFELGLFEPARADDANRDRVADLLQHHAREDGQDLHRDAVAVFVDQFDDRAVLEAEPAVRAQRRLFVIGVLLRVVEFRIAEVMRPAVVHDDPALLAQAVDPEGRQKQMQYAGVVGVLDVFGVELPVVGQYLRAAAENAGGPVQHAADAGGNFRPEIGFEIGRVVAERPEHQTGELGDPQPLQIVLVLAKLGRHAALPLDPALERDAGQFPGQVIGPAVIDAADLFDVAAPLQAQQIAAMRAAVDKGVDFALGVAGDDDRGLADRRGDVIPRIRDLGGQTQKIPGRALEDPLLFEPVLVGIGVEAERDLGQAIRGPRNSPHRVGAEL